MDSHTSQDSKTDSDSDNDLLVVQLSYKIVYSKDIEAIVDLDLSQQYGSLSSPNILIVSSGPTKYATASKCDLNSLFCTVIEVVYVKSALRQC